MHLAFCGIFRFVEYGVGWAKLCKVQHLNLNPKTIKAISALFSLISEINKAVKKNETDNAKNYAVILKMLASV